MMKQRGTWGSRSRAYAFTMIEMLVVIAIILVLAGISVKLIALVGRKSATAKTLQVLEQTRNALEAYYVAIGSYPPCTAISYDRIDPKTDFKKQFGSDPNLPPNLGLIYYLAFWSDDPKAGSWQKFAAAVNTSCKPTYHVAQGGIWGKAYYTNFHNTIVDGWGAQIHYAPNSDLSGYDLWSDGGGMGELGRDRNE